MAKIVKESLIEGVGDKYLQTKFGMDDEFAEFNKKFNMQQLEKNKKDGHNEVVADNGKIKLIKNPTSIKNFENGVRGVIDSKGNLYMSATFKGIIHVDILELLKTKGILPENVKTLGWGKKLPQDSGFLTVQRYKDTTYIAIGESNKIIYDEADWKKLIHKYDEFLLQAKKVNPTLNFTNKLVGIKIFKRKDRDEETAPHLLIEKLDDYNNHENVMFNVINKQKGI